MANTNKEFTIKINGIDVAIKNTNDLDKAVKALEANLNNNKYGASELKQFQKTLDETNKKGTDLKKELSKKANFNVTIDGAQQFISTIAELEKAKDELDEKLKKTDKGTDAFARMTDELRHVNTEIEKFDVSVEFLTIDKIMGTAGAAVGAVSGAFATATSGAALFGKQMGIDAEEVQKYADKAESLVAFLSGIQAVTSAVSGENLKNAKAVFQSVFAQKAQTLAMTETAVATGVATASSKTFGISAKAAIASTGIGLLLVAVVLLYENFDKVTATAKKFGNYIAPFVNKLKDDFNALADAIRNAASFLSGGFIDNAATAKVKGLAQDQLDILNKQEEYQKKSFDIQNKGEIEKLKNYSEFEKKKFLLLVDSGNASLSELRSQQQKSTEAEKAYADAKNAFKEEQDRKEIDLTSKTESEKSNRVKNFEANKLAKLKASVGEENELYQRQLLVVKEANKSFLTQVQSDAKERGDKAKERYSEELELTKKLVELNATSEVQKQRILTDISLQELNKLKKSHGEKSLEYRKFYAESLAQLQTYSKAVADEITAIPTVSLRDSINNTNDKEDRNKNRLPGEAYIPLTDTDKFNKALQKDLAKNNAEPIVVPVEINPAPIDRNSLKLRIDDAFIAVREQLEAGEVPRINFIDSVLGDGFYEGIAGASDEILNMIKESRVAELDAQLDYLDELDARSTEVIELAQARLDDINGKLSESDSTAKELQDAKKSAQESELAGIVDKLEKERVKRNQLAADKRKEDDRIKKSQQEQLENEKKRVELEKARQKELDKTNKILAIAKAANDAVNASLAIQAAFEAIKSGSKLPFPANLAAIAVALAATVGAIASAKSALKFEGGGKVPVDSQGVAVGPRHAQKGIPFTVAGEAGYEMEGGEHITNRLATSKNIEALDTINRLGDKVKFKVVPVRGHYEAGGVVAQANYTAISSSIKATNQDDTANQVLQLLQQQLPALYEASIALSQRPISVGVDQISEQQDRVNVIQKTGLNN